MSPSWIALLLAIGIACLYYGAEWLVEGSKQLAYRLGLTPLAVGLTVVAFGTSAPELVVSLRAALAGNSAISAGNVVGSNISNVALILGLCSILRPLRVHVQVVRIDTPIMILISLLVSGLLLTGRLEQTSGAILVIGIVSYTAFNYVMARMSGPTQLRNDVEERLEKENSTLWECVRIIAGLVTLVVGAESFVSGAVEAATQLGISDTVIGLSLVALGTSLPELATALVATWKGESDIVVGNIVGSNVFNLLCILGVTALTTPIDTRGIAWLDIGMMVATSLTLLPIVRSGLAIYRWEGGILLSCYVLYLALLFQRGI